MDWLIDDIQQNGVAATVEAAQDRPIPRYDVSAARECLGS
jgi:hypothetical protein